ncbi:MAG: pro-sigmaK processing inhibitor BofA family protein [Clostridia bacterium]|nr:pro-sigmaK processing inhibitor BofA family protein [Clostridia bacterium]
MDGMTFGTVVGYLLGLLIIFVAARIFFAPLKVIVRLLINSVIGIGILFVINLMKPVLNIYIGINAVSALVVGILGIPGLCLLMLLQVFF